ncbi:MAG: type II toxin-antitoxin system PemK/MazF family toxin [Spirochaetaceae bacterium]|nr:type II toxin-antitoxin system PemK/MazF family toxin [Spirochaetaceae bacterium]
MTRGEIWLVDFGVPMGSEVGYRRPAVVMQNNDFNASNIGTCIVIPLTSNMILSEYTPNIVVPKKDSGLSKDSVVIIPLVTTVNKFAFIEKLPVMPKSYMNKISAGVIEVLELQEGI